MLFYRILRIIAVLSALALVGGTIYGLFIRPSRMNRSEVDPGLFASPQRPLDESDLDSVFSGIGRIRSVTAGSEGSTVVLSIAFPYNSQDAVFSEELASHIADFRAIAQGYFSSQTREDLQRKDEESIKAELLIRFNQILRLGSISALYFRDYMIIE